MASKSRKSSGFTAEALFDYINESASSLAKVVAAQLSRTEDDEDEKKRASKPRKMSVMTTVKNRRSGQRVRFQSEVEVYPLPESEGRDAWLARRGHWGQAPESDEVWDGKKKVIRSNSFTKKEWIKSERKQNFSSFWDAMLPVLDRIRSDSSESDAEDLDVEVQVALLDEEEDSESKETDRGAEAEPEPDDLKKPNTDLNAVYKKKSNPKFAFEVPSVKVEGGKKEDDLLKQNLLGKKLSPSQAAVAAAAGKVLVMKKSDGRAFGAAVKRKVQLKSQKAKVRLGRPDANEIQAASKRRSKQRGIGAGDRNSKRRSKIRRRKQSIRSPGTGFGMRNRYIVILFFIPLMYLALDDLWPLFEQVYWLMTRRKGEVRTRRTGGNAKLPFWAYLLFPDTNNKALRDTVSFGAYAIEIGGLIILIQVVYQLIVLFRAGRSVIKVEIAEDDSDDEESVWSTGEDGSNYAYLFKWQQPNKVLSDEEDDED